MSEKIRIGAVSYLNTKPLVYQLEALAPDAELVLDYPSRLADRMAKGTLEVALIPVIESSEDSVVPAMVGPQFRSVSSVRSPFPWPDDAGRSAQSPAVRSRRPECAHRGARRIARRPLRRGALRRPRFPVAPGSVQQ